jgi:hypothetical protein
MYLAFPRICIGEVSEDKRQGHCGSAFLFLISGIISEKSLPFGPDPGEYFGSHGRGVQNMPVTGLTRCRFPFHPKIFKRSPTALSLWVL